jgi:hypothetical protein
LCQDAIKKLGWCLAGGEVHFTELSMKVDQQINRIILPIMWGLDGACFTITGASDPCKLKMLDKDNTSDLYI